MVLDIVLWLILVVCTVTDVMNRKIYNAVIVPGLLFAFVMHAFLGSWMLSLLGFLVGLGLLFIPFALGGMGAGDVKLLALVGALKGASFVLHAAVYMALLGGGLALGMLLLRKDVIQRIRGLLFFLHSRRFGVQMPFPWPRAAMKKTYPYGVAIAGGVLLHYVSKGWLH